MNVRIIVTKHKGQAGSWMENPILFGITSLRNNKKWEQRYCPNTFRMVMCTYNPSIPEILCHLQLHNEFSISLAHRRL